MWASSVSDREPQGFVREGEGQPWAEGALEAVLRKGRLQVETRQEARVRGEA